MHVTAILFPGCSLMPWAVTRQVIDAANAQAGRVICGSSWQSLTGTPLRAADGTRLVPATAGYPRFEEADLLMLVAGDKALAHLPLSLRGCLLRAGLRGATLGGVGGGVSVLQHLGFVAGKDVPAHLHRLSGKRLLVPDETALAEALEGWITENAGVLLSTPDIAAQGAVPAHRRCPDTTRMLALMSARLDRPLPLSEICATLRLSPKQLRRRCHSSLGRSPSQAYQDLRLSKAARLLQQTTLPIAEIARATTAIRKTRANASSG